MKNFILVNDTTTQNNWGCHSTTKHFRNFFLSNGFQEKGTVMLRDLHGNNYAKKSFNNFKDVDFLAINGEGSLYDFQKKGINIINYIKMAKAKKPELKVLLLNSTFDLKNENLRKIILQTSHLVNLYGAREKTSLSNLKGLGIENVVLQPDFLYEKIDFSCSKKDYVVIGGNSNYYRPDRPRYDAMGAYDHIIGNLKSSCEIVLYSADMSDIRFLEPLSKKHGLRHISCANTGWESAFDVLSKAKASISGRYHPSIMALCGVTPCFFVSANNCKMLGTHDYFYKNQNCYVHSHKLKEDSKRIFDWLDKEFSTGSSKAEVERGLVDVADILKKSKEEILKAII